MYTTSLLTLLSWPALIIVAWLAVRIAIHFYERKQKKFEKLMED
jgi:hypothetical protein